MLNSSATAVGRRPLFIHTESNLVPLLIRSNLRSEGLRCCLQGSPNEGVRSGRAAAGRATALRLRRLASARPRPCPAPSPLPTPSPPPPLPTTTGAAPPPAASSISPRRQQLWPSYGCRCRRHACRCGPLRWLPPLGCCSRCLAVPMLAGCSCLSCWWLAAAWSCAQKLHWNAWMHGIC